MNRFRLIVVLLGCLAAEGVFAANVSSSMLSIERFNAERGDAHSQYFMGEHYELGDSGIGRDLPAALEWYRKAARGGNAAAQYKIGAFYEQGLAGLGADMAKALEWYNTAASNGSDVAIQRLGELKQAELDAERARREQQQENEKERARQDALRQERARNAMLQANKPPMTALPVTVPAAATKERPPQEWMAQLLGERWSLEKMPAEYLPADEMSCLKTSEGEITCFSRERRRVLGNHHLTYTVKSVLNGFAGDGSFVVLYHFNVVSVERAPQDGPQRDRFGLSKQEGWQQPGHTVRCRLEKKDRVVCSGEIHDEIAFGVM